MTTMTQPRLTGKRRSMDIKEMDYPVKTVPLVPDLPRAQKAIIHEEMAKSLLLTESAALSQTSSRPQPREDDVLARSESKSHKFGRKIKGLFLNDQSKAPSRKQSIDTRTGQLKSKVSHDDLDHDDLYRFDGRSKHQWGGTGI